METRWVRVLDDGAARWGRIVDEQIALQSRPPWDAGATLAGSIAREGATLLPPCEPQKILGVGTNYRAHAAEMGKPIPDEPLLFMKPVSALLAPGAPIVRPRGFQRTDFEGELAVVIGRRCRRVDESRALDFVLGYTICNDVTVRDLQKKDGQFTRAKGFDTFCPVGPELVSGLDPSSLRITTRLNGAVKQDSSTSDLIFSVARCIAVASRVMTLEPGDLITTGTPPGVGPIAPGDVVEIAIEGIGTLRNPVEPELEESES